MSVCIKDQIQNMNLVIGCTVGCPYCYARFCPLGLKHALYFSSIPGRRHDSRKHELIQVICMKHEHIQVKYSFEHGDESLPHPPSSGRACLGEHYARTQFH